MQCLVIIPAAGRGARFGGDLPKQYLPLRGTPILVRTVEQFLSAPFVARVVVCVSEDFVGRVDRFRETRDWRRVSVTIGGSTRQESVLRGLEASKGDPRGLVAVHDAVRPFVSPSLIEQVLRAADQYGAAVPVTVLNDTIHRVRDGFVFETPDRAELFAAQTPQIFRRSVLERALELATRDGVRATDEAAAVTRSGVAVRVVSGDARNVKITNAEDLRLAEANFDLWSAPEGVAG